MEVIMNEFMYIGNNEIERLIYKIKILEKNIKILENRIIKLEEEKKEKYKDDYMYMI